MKARLVTEARPQYILSPPFRLRVFHLFQAFWPSGATALNRAPELPLLRKFHLLSPVIPIDVTGNGVIV